MVIIPREKPVIENLNIYYLDVRKLIEHYQGEIGSGGVYMKSHSAEGAIFFDKDDLLNGFFQEREKELVGPAAITHIFETGSNYNFTVNIYRIAPEEVYFWSSIPTAEKIYKDLSTEFTDLEGLIKKMSSEKLTGYIDVSIGNGQEGGLIFIINGKIMGGSFSWGNGEPGPTKKNQDLLIQKTKLLGGSFNVCRIPLAKMQVAADAQSEPQSSDDVLGMLEAFLEIVESVVATRKKRGADFHKLLKRKFIENADKYAFLDPFAGEFEYENRRITFAGVADEKELVNGVVESTIQLSQELGIMPTLSKRLASWSDEYSEEMDKYGVKF